MKLIWHIFLKDLRRLAWPLALWGVVIVMQFLAWRLASARRLEGHSAEQGPVNAVMLLWVLHLIAAWLIVPQLIHDDPLVSDNAGWRVRPVSGVRLLMAKLFGLGMMLCLWPSLLTVPWWLNFGFGWSEIARAVAVNTLGMALLAGLATMVAVLTDSLARFLAWSMVLLAAAGLGGLILVAGMPLHGDGPVHGSILITRAWLAVGVMLAAAAIVVPMQFLWRRTAGARSGVAAAGVVAALIVQGWPWSAAQMLAKTGMKNHALPVVTTRVSEATLVVPASEGKQQASVRVATEFLFKGRLASDFPRWSGAEPQWRLGASRGPDLPVALESWSHFDGAAKGLVRGIAKGGDGKDVATWQMDLPGQATPLLRNGEAALSARYHGAIWHGETGPSVAVRAGAGAARGLRQLHVSSVSAVRHSYRNRDERGVAWVATGPLFTPSAMLEILNKDGMGRSAHESVVLTNGESEIADYIQGDYEGNKDYLPNLRIPVGVVGVSMQWSSFDRWWWRNDDLEENEARLDSYLREGVTTPRLVAFEGATLGSVFFQEVAPLEVALSETAFVPDVVLEGRLDEAQRRAKAEGKLVLARVPGTRGDEERRMIPQWWDGSRVREILRSRFVCVLISRQEIARLRKPTDDPAAATLVVLTSDGEERDRLRDLGGADLLVALRANTEGKTYAALLTELMAARGGDERRLRFQLHEALRARGELAGAFDAILWMVDHPAAPFEGTEIFGVGLKLQKFVATYGPAREALLERRERALANLRQDARDPGAARMLFSITLGLRLDEAVWREFPRLMPHENPLWWEFTRNWISRTVSDKNYREAAEAVDLEKFFAEGPAWVRAQLLQKRSWSPGGPPVPVGEWQKQLVRTGLNCIEALASADQGEAALRLTRTVLRIDTSADIRRTLVSTLLQHGARAQAKQLMMEKPYAP